MFGLPCESIIDTYFHPSWKPKHLCDTRLTIRVFTRASKILLKLQGMKMNLPRMDTTAMLCEVSRWNCRANETRIGQAYCITETVRPIVWMKSIIFLKRQFTITWTTHRRFLFSWLPDSTAKWQPVRRFFEVHNDSGHRDFHRNWHRPGSTFQRQFICLRGRRAQWT